MDTTTQVINFVSNNYGTLTGIGFSIWGLVKTDIFPSIKTFIQEKNNAIKDEKTKSLVTDAETRVEKLLVESMSAIETTTKEELVKKIENGELNKDALKTLLPTVVKKVKNQLSDTYKNALTTESGSLEDYLITKAQYFYDKMSKDNDSVIGTIKVSDIANVLNKSVDALTSSDIIALQNQLQQSQTDKETVSQQLAQVQSQLQQSQTEKDSLSQQINSISNDKTIIEQQLSQLTNQIADLQNQNQSLTSDKQALQAKIDSITQVATQ
jgi:chromosome segregation ATPase